MIYTHSFKLKPGAILLAGLISGSGYAADDLAAESEEMVVLAPAEEQLKQQPGVSIITAEDIAKDPPVNDLSDIIRKMPGVNLTGNSASGSRGNNRQIDIRGMGPENTLILIDGVPPRRAIRFATAGAAKGTPAAIPTGCRRKWLSASKCCVGLRRRVTVPVPPAV